MELPLQGCTVTYTPKDSKKKKHELKISQPGTDPLVLAVQSQEQAEQWLRVSDRTPESSPVHRHLALVGSQPIRISKAAPLSFSTL